MSSVLNLTFGEKEILERVYADYRKYGVLLEINSNGDYIYYFPKTSDIIDLYGTYLINQFKASCIDHGFKNDRFNEIILSISDKHWSWTEYINTASKNKLEEDLKDIKNQDLSLHRNSLAKDTPDNNDTVKHSEHDDFYDKLKDKWGDVIDDNMLYELKRSIQNMKCMMSFTPALNTFIKLQAMLSKSMMMYGVLLDKTYIDDNNNMVLKISVPNKSDYLINGKEAAGQYLAKCIATANRKLFEPISNVKVSFKERDEFWSASIGTTMGSIASEAYSEICDLTEFYYLDI